MKMNLKRIYFAKIKHTFPSNEKRVEVLIPAFTNKSHLGFFSSPLVYQKKISTLRSSLIYIVNDTKRLQFNSALLKGLSKHLQNLITY